MVPPPPAPRQATRIPLPDMAWPISRRVLADCFFVVFIITLILAAGRGCIKKPTADSGRGFLSKLKLQSTSADGPAAYDDDQQCNLSNPHLHSRHIIVFIGRGQVLCPEVFTLSLKEVRVSFSARRGIRSLI